MALLTSSWAYDVLAILIGSLTLLYFYVKHVYSYWERRGIPSMPDLSYLVGHFKTTFTQKESLGLYITRVYNSTKEPFIGIYSILKPIIVIRDPELVRTVLIKDFNNFSDRGTFCNEERDPLSGLLFSLPTQRWKYIRGKISPTFTTGKLKAMFPTLVGCGSKLQNHLDKLAKKGELLDVLEISASHSTNVIASIAFGIEVDTIANPTNEFRFYGKKIFAPTVMNGIRYLLMFIAPKLMDYIRMKSVDSSVEKFIFSVVKQNLDYREKNNFSRKDFFQLLIQLRNTGEVQKDDIWETDIKADESQKTLSLNEVAAQTFNFFTAGFETSSTTLTFCMYELARHQDIQARCHEEIDRVLAKHNGNISYESISEMKFLEACIDETLRRYAIVPVLNRTCMKDYVIPGTNKIIEKGVEVFIPAYALQMDEQFYDEPKKFKPERFYKASSSEKKPIYLAFGDGPRNCIGLRMGQIQTKVGLVLLMQNYKYQLERSLLDWEMEFDPKLFLSGPLRRIYLEVIKREKYHQAK